MWLTQPLPPRPAGPVWLCWLFLAGRGTCPAGQGLFLRAPRCPPPPCLLLVGPAALWGVRRCGGHLVPDHPGQGALAPSPGASPRDLCSLDSRTGRQWPPHPPSAGSGGHVVTHFLLPLQQALSSGPPRTVPAGSGQAECQGSRRGAGGDGEELLSPAERIFQVLSAEVTSSL